MGIRYVAVCLLLAVGSLIAFEPSMVNLTTPSRLENTESVFKITHRFYGPVNEDPLESFFGLDAGANVSLGMRYALLPRLELNAAYTRFQKEYVLGASYAYFLPQIFVGAQLDVQFFSFKGIGIDERNENFYYALSLQTEPLFDVVRPVINAGFDGYNEKFGVAFGMSIGTDIDIGPVNRLDLIAEYYPVIDRDDAVHAAENSFAFGIKAATYGHNFMLLVGNNSQISPRRLMLGAVDNDLYFGFNVHRHLDL